MRLSTDLSALIAFTSTPLLHKWQRSHHSSSTLFPQDSNTISDMTFQLVLPNELMLLLYKHQTTIPDLLALSSTSRNMRSLFLDNASHLLPAVCKNASLLSAAQALVSVISQVAKSPSPTCVCPPTEEYHCHKHVANQQYMADASSPFSTGLRDWRTTSRALNVAMLVANKANEFWTARAATCPANHKPPTVDRKKFAQAYLLLWVCAESHFSSDFESRTRKLKSELSHQEIMLLREIYEFTSFDLDWPTKLSTGSADPEDDEEEDIKPEEVWFKLMNRGERLDISYDVETNSPEWTFWNHWFDGAWRGLTVPHGMLTEWEEEKPSECHCPKATWVKWNLVHFDWWHTWKRIS